MFTTMEVAEESKIISPFVMALKEYLDKEERSFSWFAKKLGKKRSWASMVFSGDRNLTIETQEQIKILFPDFKF